MIKFVKGPHEVSMEALMLSSNAILLIVLDITWLFKTILNYSAC